MPIPPLSKLPEDQRQSLLDDLNYLNEGEIRMFCRRHSIPHRIAIQTQEGGSRQTKDIDRKGVILDRIRHFLNTGEILEQTCFPASVVCFGPLPDALTENDRLFYDQYDKSNRAMIALLKDLTGGEFRSGAIARILARDFWSMGKAPTFREFAAAWLQASREHTRPNPEWAFLSDRATKGGIANWKSMRAQKAAHVLQVLDRITA